MDKATRAKHEDAKRARSEVNKRTAVLRTAQNKACGPALPKDS